MTTVLGMSRRMAVGAALVLAALGAACKGNVNDDSVPVLDLDLVSRSFQGGPANSSARDPHMSADGRYVVFSSNASNLDPRDPNTISDIFVRDMEAGMTFLVSVNYTGTGPGNDYSYDPRISPDGRFVAFTSYASNLAPAGFDTNGMSDVFVRDLWSDVTVPVSVDSGETATANYGSWNRPGVTSDLNNVYVVFDTGANNLVATPVTPMYRNQVYLRRIPIATFSIIGSGQTAMVSVDPAGTAAGNSSSNYPVIGQEAANVCIAWTSSSTNLSALDANGTDDVYFRRFTKAGPAPVEASAVLVSVDYTGTRGGGDGTGAPTSFLASRYPAISEDGLFVAFETEAIDLLDPSPVGDPDFNGSMDIYMRGPMVPPPPTATIRVSVSSNWDQGLADSRSAAVSSNGQYVAFESTAPNLVADDTNGVGDVFLRDTVNFTTVRVSMTVFAAEANQDSYSPTISGDGRTSAFNSEASNIMPGVAFFSTQVYRRRF